MQSLLRMMLAAVYLLTYWVFVIQQSCSAVVMVEITLPTDEQYATTTTMSQENKLVHDPSGTKAITTMDRRAAVTVDSWPDYQRTEISRGRSLGGTSAPTSAPTLVAPPPTTLAPSPTTSAPTLVAPPPTILAPSPSPTFHTFSPSLSPSTRKPTPQTSGPTQSPTKSPQPTTFAPTPSPAPPTFSPSLTPSTRMPTSGPTQSPTKSHVTSAPSPSPSKSTITTAPTGSPTTSDSVALNFQSEANVAIVGVIAGGLAFALVALVGLSVLGIPGCFAIEKCSPTQLWYGSDVKHVQKLKRFLASSKGDPDFVPKYQHPWCWTNVSLPMLWVINVGVALTYLAATFRVASNMASSSCLLDPTGLVYYCLSPKPCVLATDATFGSYLSDCGFLPVLLGSIAVFVGPPFFYGFLVLVFGWGRKNTSGSVGGQRSSLLPHNDTSDGQHLSLLHFAVMYNCEPSVRMLVEEFHANRQILDSKGRAPVHLKEEFTISPKIIALLTDGKAVEWQESYVFCSHAWGRDGVVHKRVVGIADDLESLGISTWIDRERLRGNIVKQMTDGIDKAKVVLVFVTKAYIDKVGGPDETDNCKLEFLYAARTKVASDSIIPVLLEKDLKDTAKWLGPVGFYLGKSLYVDLTATEEPMKSQQLSDLANRIKMHLRGAGRGNAD